MGTELCSDTGRLRGPVNVSNGLLGAELYIIAITLFSRFGGAVKFLHGNRGGIGDRTLHRKAHQIGIAILFKLIFRHGKSTQ